MKATVENNGATVTVKAVWYTPQAGGFATVSIDTAEPDCFACATVPAQTWALSPAVRIAFSDRRTGLMIDPFTTVVVTAETPEDEAALAAFRAAHHAHGGCHGDKVTGFLLVPDATAEEWAAGRNILTGR